MNSKVVQLLLHVRTLKTCYLKYAKKILLIFLHDILYAAIIVLPALKITKDCEVICVDHLIFAVVKNGFAPPPPANTARIASSL